MSTRRIRFLRTYVAFGLLASAGAPLRADEEAANLSDIVVTATRSAQPAFDVPASIDAVALDAYGANTPGINPSEGSLYSTT